MFSPREETAPGATQPGLLPLWLMVGPAEAGLGPGLLAEAWRAVLPTHKGNKAWGGGQGGMSLGRGAQRFGLRGLAAILLGPRPLWSIHSETATPVMASGDFHNRQWLPSWILRKNPGRGLSFPALCLLPLSIKGIIRPALPLTQASCPDSGVSGGRAFSAVE